MLRLTAYVRQRRVVVAEAQSKMWDTDRVEEPRCATAAAVAFSEEWVLLLRIETSPPAHLIYCSLFDCARVKHFGMWNEDLLLSFKALSSQRFISADALVTVLFLYSSVLVHTYIHIFRQLFYYFFCSFALCFSVYFCCYSVTFCCAFFYLHATLGFS